MKPMLLSTSMVQAVLENRKSQTRRIIKIPDGMSGHPFGKAGDENNPLGFMYPCGIKRPQYNLGDIIYLRETWARMCDDTFVYLADYQGITTYDDANGEPIKWKPSIHMPKEAARLFLQITDIWSEKLQDIRYDNGDIWREGIPAVHDRDNEIRHFIYLWDCCYAKPRPVCRKIDGEKVIDFYVSYPWEDIQQTREYRGKPCYVHGNPPVFVYEFERISKEDAENDIQRLPRRI